MDAIGTLRRDQSGITMSGLNGKSVLFKRERSNGILAALIISRLAVEDLGRADTLNPNSTPAGEELQRINAVLQ